MQQDTSSARDGVGQTMLKSHSSVTALERLKADLEKRRQKQLHSINQVSAIEKGTGTPPPSTMASSSSSSSLPSVAARREMWQQRQPKDEEANLSLSKGSKSLIVRPSREASPAVKKDNGAGSSTATKEDDETAPTRRGRQTFFLSLTRPKESPITNSGLARNPAASPDAKEKEPSVAEIPSNPSPAATQTGNSLCNPAACEPQHSQAKAPPQVKDTPIIKPSASPTTQTGDSLATIPEDAQSGQATAAPQEKEKEQPVDAAASASLNQTSKSPTTTTPEGAQSGQANASSTEKEKEHLAVDAAAQITCASPTTPTGEGLATTTEAQNSQTTASQVKEEQPAPQLVTTTAAAPPPPPSLQLTGASPTTQTDVQSRLADAAPQEKKQPAAAAAPPPPPPPSLPDAAVQAKPPPECTASLGEVQSGQANNKTYQEQEKQPAPLPVVVAAAAPSSPPAETTKAPQPHASAAGGPTTTSKAQNETSDLETDFKEMMLDLKFTDEQKKQMSMLPDSHKTTIVLQWKKKKEDAQRTRANTISRTKAPESTSTTPERPPLEHQVAHPDKDSTVGQQPLRKTTHIAAKAINAADIASSSSSSAGTTSPRNVLSPSSNTSAWNRKPTVTRSLGPSVGTYIIGRSNPSNFLTDTTFISSLSALSLSLSRVCVCVCLLCNTHNLFCLISPWSHILWLIMRLSF